MSNHTISLLPNSWQAWPWPVWRVWYPWRRPGPPWKNAWALISSGLLTGWGNIPLHSRHLQMEKLEWVMGFTHASIVVFRSLHDWLEIIAFINLPSPWAEDWSGAASPACSIALASDSLVVAVILPIVMPIEVVEVLATTWEQRHRDL